MKINRLDHYNIRTSKPDETLRFYVDVLGLQNAPEQRPSSGTAGTWILIGDYPAIHVNFVDTDQSNPDLNNPTGALDHIAFEASGYREYEAVFEREGLAYRKFERPERDLCQLFLHDPNGVKIEINIRGELTS